jgi:hypothetical protein
MDTNIYFEGYSHVGPRCPGPKGGPYGARVGCGKTKWQQRDGGFRCSECNAFVDSRLMSALCSFQAKEFIVTAPSSNKQDTVLRTQE